MDPRHRRHAALRRCGQRLSSVLGSRVMRCVILAVLVGQMGLVMATSAQGDSPTFDEPAHLGSGLAYVELGDLRMNPEHPPFAKLLAGGSVALFSSTNVPSDGAQFDNFDQSGFGNRILYRSGNDTKEVLRLARLPMIAMAMALVLVAYGFAVELFGYLGGLFTAALVSLDPNLLAHGRYVTTDVPVTLFLVSVLYLTLVIYRRGLAWPQLALVGVSIGLALATKYSALLLLPVLAGLTYLAAVRTKAEERPTSRDALVATLSALCIAVGVVWLVYLVIDPSLSFDRKPVRQPEAQRMLLDLLPLPRAYREGFGMVLTTDRAGRVGYLFGEFYFGGRPTFFPAALALKTPIGTLVSWLLGSVLIFRRRAVAGMLFLTVPAAWWLVLAITSKTNLGVRHVIIVSVLLSIGAAALVASGRSRLRYLALPLLAATAVSSWSAAPGHLAYVNEAFGGPERAGELMSDSNVDWGQDLFRLEDRLRRRYPSEPRPWILYFGRTDLDAFKVDFRNVLDADPQLVDGLVAISISATNSGYRDVARELIDRGTLIETVGNSIELYRVRPAP